MDEIHIPLIIKEDGTVSRVGVRADHAPNKFGGVKAFGACTFFGFLAGILFGWLTWG